ncbi:MAG: iron ABC transporter permease, partial [Lentisphaerae bacterium]
PVSGGWHVDWLDGPGKFWLVCLVEALHLYPILYLNILAALGNVDGSLLQAAENLGASPWQRFRRITVPLIMPGIFAGVSIVFIWSFTELGTPLMLGFLRVTPVQIFNGITELETNPMPYTRVLVTMFISVIMYGGVRLFLRVPAHLTSATKGTGQSIGHAGRWTNLLTVVFFSVIITLAILPHLSVILLAFTRDWYASILPEKYTLLHFRHALIHSYVVPSISNSIQYSLAATVLCLFISGVIALNSTRWRLPGAPLFDLAGMIPLAVPGLVMAFGYLALAIRIPYASLREMLDPLKNPLFFLILAYAVRRLPYGIRSLTAGLQQSPEELELAARSLGASPLTTLRRITIPLVISHILIAFLFVFSFSMLEVSDSLILAQTPGTFPITRAIYELSFILGSGPYIACAFGTWAMFFLAGTMFAAVRLLGKRFSSIFRF